MALSEVQCFVETSRIPRNPLDDVETVDIFRNVIQDQFPGQKGYNVIIARTEELYLGFA